MSHAHYFRLESPESPDELRRRILKRSTDWRESSIPKVLRERGVNRIVVRAFDENLYVAGQLVRFGLSALQPPAPGFGYLCRVSPRAGGGSLLEATPRPRPITLEPGVTGGYLALFSFFVLVVGFNFGMGPAAILLGVGAAMLLGTLSGYAGAGNVLRDLHGLRLWIEESCAAGAAT